MAKINFSIKLTTIAVDAILILESIPHPALVKECSKEEFCFCTTIFPFTKSIFLSLPLKIRFFKKWNIISGSLNPDGKITGK